VGFLIASPIALRRGWLIEQVIRGREAPNGTAELMIDAAVRAMAAAGDEFITLGLSALAQREERVVNPPWLRPLFSLARAHGRRFYNFDGLERFKAKFRPHAWEPVYMISQEHHFSFGTLLAVAGVFTGGHLGRAFVGTMLRAVKQELRWLRQR
jgi:phosphatidylglycerol lysyltransferase